MPRRPHFQMLDLYLTMELAMNSLPVLKELERGDVVGGWCSCCQLLQLYLIELINLGETAPAHTPPSHSTHAILLFDPDAQLDCDDA